MYQKARGITGLPWRLDATNCTTQRPPNISAPASPISFHGDMCRPVQASQASGAFMKSADTGSDLPDLGDLGPADQPGHAAQVGDAHHRAIEVVVLGHAGGA